MSKLRTEKEEVEFIRRYARKLAEASGRIMLASKWDCEDARGERASLYNLHTNHYETVKPKPVDFHTAKHNRDVELTDLLAHLLDRYGDLMTPQDRERIDELMEEL